MDINILGAQYLNQAHNPFSSSQTLPGLGSGAGFEELLLRRAQNPAENAPVSSTPAIVKNNELYELCMELETFLIKNLIKSMRSTVQKTNLIDTGFAGEVYEDMLYDEYAKTFARNANLGFAEMAYRELTGNR